MLIIGGVLILKFQHKDDVSIGLLQFHQGFPCFLRGKLNIDLSTAHLLMTQ